MIGNIGHGDDRGRWIFLVILVFAVVGKVVPQFVDVSRATWQSWMAVALVPFSLYAFWSLREVKSRGRADASKSETEAATSEHK